MIHRGTEKGLSDPALQKLWINPAAMDLELVSVYHHCVVIELRNRNSITISKSDISAAVKEHRRHVLHFNMKLAVSHERAHSCIIPYLLVWLKIKDLKSKATLMQVSA